MGVWVFLQRCLGVLQGYRGVPTGYVYKWAVDQGTACSCGGQILGVFACILYRILVVVTVWFDGNTIIWFCENVLVCVVSTMSRSWSLLVIWFHCVQPSSAVSHSGRYDMITNTQRHVPCSSHRWAVGIVGGWCVCVCVWERERGRERVDAHVWESECACVYERERERERERGWLSDSNTTRSRTYHRECSLHEIRVNVVKKVFWFIIHVTVARSLFHCHLHLM